MPVRAAAAKSTLEAASAWAPQRQAACKRVDCPDSESQGDWQHQAGPVRRSLTRKNRDPGRQSSGHYGKGTTGAVEHETLPVYPDRELKCQLDSEQAVQVPLSTSSWQVFGVHQVQDCISTDNETTVMPRHHLIGCGFCPKFFPPSSCQTR
jgi:hypothetical protein